MRKIPAVLAAAAAVAMIALGSARAPSAEAATTSASAPAAAALTAARTLAATHHSATFNAWHFALDQIRKPYVWADAGPGGYDCSGLVMAAYRAAGISLPHNTVAMLDSGKLIPTSHPVTGSLAFYGTGHVEIYVRPGWTFGAQEPGTVVGYHQYNSFWHPTMFFRVAGAG